MKYSRLIGYVAGQLWAMYPPKLDEILAVLAHRSAGHTFTAEEIQARIGGGLGPAVGSQSGGVAIIPICGMIANRMGSMDDSSGGTSCERIAAMIDQVPADISTIVYQFDTPGGTVTGLAALADKMFALRGVKKQIAVNSGMCASAGYWLASQCDEIVSDVNAETGSIGVRWTPHADLSAALENEGIVITEIYAGKYKIEGTSSQPMSAETKAFKQAQADAVYSQFLSAVARGRGTTPAAVKAGYGEGRVLFAKDAKAAGLIDKIGTMNQTLSRLMGRPVGGSLRAAVTTSSLRADVHVLVCECSEDCPCQNGGVCGENCATCEPDCACVAPETESATPVPMSAGATSAARMRRLL